MNRAKYEFRVLGRFEAHLKGNEDHVTINVLAGPDWDHLSICGTLTMTESQWATLLGGLERGMRASVRVSEAVATSARAAGI